MFNKYIIIFLLSFILAGCYTTEPLVSSPTDQVAYYQEKNRVYWEIKNNPKILDDKIYQDKWFEAWKTSDPELREIYIKETIDLYKNRKGE